jgi:hypothetical protein
MDELLEYLFSQGVITPEQFDHKVATYKAEFDARPKNPDEIFLSLDYDSINIQDLQTAKNEQLNYLCNTEILNGFSSDALGGIHEYGFSYEDQINLSSFLTILNEDTTIESTYWKTKDAGVLPHSRDQFKALCKDAQNHKQGKIAQFWTLKAQVLAATTPEEILAINWVV